MDVEEQSIVEEYGSSLEDLTFNSKPLINVLTMLAEENSRYAGSVTKLVEERIYKVSQQHKLPSLYLLDSIIKNVGGTYLNLIAQVLVKVFVSVFEKGDEKTRKDLYKLRHTWPQYFSAKVLHDVDVSINKLDPGWPITAVPPPSPSIHVNPKFLKKAEVITKPQIPVVVPDASKDDEKVVMVEHQKRLAQLQKLQDEQLRLTEQEIQEHQLKRDLILKKQEQERKALLTQQQQVLLTLRLESELEETTELPEKASNRKTVSTKAETTPSTHNITTNRDPRLQRQEQAPSHDNNNGSQHPRVKDNITVNRSQSLDPRERGQSNFQRRDRNIERTRLTSPNSSSKRRSRSQSPINEREKKYPRHEDHPKNKDTRPDLEKRNREDRNQRRKSLDGSEDARRELPKKQEPVNERGFRGRGFNRRGRGRNGRHNREERGLENRGPRGRDEETRQRVGQQNAQDEGHNSPRMQIEDIATRPKLDGIPVQERTIPGENIPDLVQPKPLLSDQEVMAIRSNDSTKLTSGQDPESATIPQELTLEHKSVILEEAKRRLEAGHISQEQYIELIDKLAEFYELQRQQEIETLQVIPDGKTPLHEQDMVEHPEGHGSPKLDTGNLNQSGRGGRPKRLPRKRKPNEGSRHPRRDGPPRKEPRMEEPWRREGPRMIDGPPRANKPDGFEGPPRPSRVVRIEEQRRDPRHVRIDGPPMDRPPENGPWRGGEHERLPPLHDHRPIPHHVFIDGRHPPDEGQPGRFIPQSMDERDFRGPAPQSMDNFHGGPPRPFEEPPRRGEIVHDRDHLHDMPSFGHGRPDEHFQGPNVGPGHHGLPRGPGPQLLPGRPGHEVPPHAIPDHPVPTVGPGPQGSSGPGPDHQVPPIRLGGPSHQVHPLEPGHQLPPMVPGQQGPGVPQGSNLGPPHLQQVQIAGPGSPQRPGTETPPMSIPLMTPPTPSRMDKKTVDDLFSRLVQVGIIKVEEEPMINTPPRIGTPPVIQQPMNPNPIRPHPVSSSSSVAPQAIHTSSATSQSKTITSMSFQKLQQMIAKSKEATTTIPQIGLNTEDMKKRYSGIINMLYEGTQCSSCGLRFAGEAAAFYREHLDWHFRRNRREKDGRRIAHKQWYIPLKDWLDYEEITDPEEKAHSSFFDSEKPDTNASAMKTQGGDGSCPVLSTDSEAETVCDICQEKFEQFWEELQEEWHYKEAIRVGRKTYHEVCYQDAKSNVEETAPEAEANVGHPGSREESPNSSPKVKKEETPDVKKEDSNVDKGTRAAPIVKKEESDPIVKKEESLPVVKIEVSQSGEPQCSESGKIEDKVLTQEGVAIQGEVKVKVEVLENTDSEINAEEENKDQITIDGSDDTNSGNKNNTIESTNDK